MTCARCNCRLAADNRAGMCAPCEDTLIRYRAELLEEALSALATIRRAFRETHYIR